MIKIEINNTTRYPVNKKVIQRTVDKCVKFLKFNDIDLSIAFVSDKEIRKMNKIYRGVDKPTDVLSFGCLARDCSTLYKREEGYHTKNFGVVAGGIGGGFSPLFQRGAGGDFSMAGTGKRENAGMRDEVNYAEIIISYETAQKQTGENKISISEEIKKLLIHALLHLSGFDHETDKDAKEMEKAEKILLDC